MVLWHTRAPVRHSYLAGIHIDRSENKASIIQSREGGSPLFFVCHGYFGQCVEIELPFQTAYAILTRAMDALTINASERGKIFREKGEI